MRITDTIVQSEQTGDFPYETEVYQRSIRAFYPLDQKNSSLSQTKMSAIAQMTHVGELEPIKLESDLNPGDQMTVTLGVFGKRSCSGGIVQLSYGHVEKSNPESFYTRELSIPFILTVVSALSFKNTDVLPFSSAAVSATTSPSLVAVTERSLSVEEVMMNPRLSTSLDSKNDESNTFILTFDLRNEWDEPFKVTFETFDDFESGIPSSTSSTILHAGVTKRFYL